MGSPRQHAMEKNQDQRNKFNQSNYNKNKKAIDIFQNKLRSDVNAQFKMRGLDPKSNDPAVRKILESIVGRAKSKNDKYMRSLGIRTNMPRPKQRPIGRPIPKQKPTGTPTPKRPTRTPTQNKDQAALKKANENRMSKDIEVRMGQLAIDTGRRKGTKSTVGDRSVDIEERMSQLAIERGLKKPTQATQTPKVATPRKRPTGTPVPQAKESPASIAARKRFNDRLKKQTATYNKTKQKPTGTPKPLKPTTAKQKGIPPSVIKKMNEANKKMQARVFGRGKNPTSKRTFART